MNNFNEDLKKLENQGFNNSKIDKLLNEIQKEYKISKDTLASLFEFKLEKWISNVSNTSIEYRNDLIEEIKKLSSLGEIESFDKNILEVKHLEVLASKIIQINKLNKLTQSEIDKLRSDLNLWFYEDLFSTKSLILPWNKNILEKLKNPQSNLDEVIWFWVWITESFAIVWKFSYETLISLLKSPIDLVNILRWKQKLETNIKI